MLILYLLFVLIKNLFFYLKKRNFGHAVTRLWWCGEITHENKAKVCINSKTLNGWRALNLRQFKKEPISFIDLANTILTHSEKQSHFKYEI